MTHDNDLIRRGDAMDMCHGYWRDTRTRIMSIPAVAASQPDCDCPDTALCQDGCYAKQLAASQPADPVINADSRQRVAVKPLVWRQQSHDCHVAKTNFGDTAIQNESHALAPDRWGWWMVGSDEDDSPSGYAVTVEAAIDAAQADYAARIMSAIDVHPDPRDWQIAALVDAIENIRVTYLLPPSFQLPLDLAIAAVKGENK